MPVTNMSSKDKLKGWFRKRSKSRSSSSAKSKLAPDTNESLQSTIQAPGSSAEVASLKSVQTSIESSTSDSNDKSALILRSSATVLPQVAAVTNEADVAVQNQDPWQQVESFLNDEDRELLKSIDKSDDRETVFADLQEAVAEKKRISQENAWKIKFGGRRIVLRDVTAKIVDWLNSYREIGDLISQADPVYVGPLWSAIKIVLSVLSTDQQQMGLILIGVEQVVCLVTRCSIYQQLYLDDASPLTKAHGQAVAQLSNAMARLYAKMVSFLAYYLRLLDFSSTVRTLKSFSNPGEVSEMLSEIGTYEKRVATEASVCETATVRPSLQRIDENSRNTRVQLREIMSRLDKEMMQLWKQLNEDERCKILQWVSDIPYESDHYTARKGRVDGTGQWLLNHNVYTTWRSLGKSCLLWLNGIPGAGKTKLSSRVVDDILSAISSESHKNTGFAYFYCDRNRADHNEPVAIIRSIIRQLCAAGDNSSIEACVEERHLRRKAKGFASDRLVVEEARQLLLELVAGFRNVYIVVDGLDECDRATRHLLMDMLDEIIEQFPNSVKVFIASRTDQDLRKRYHEGTHLEVTANDNQGDIEKFVLNRMEQSEFCRNRLSPKLRNKILGTFQDKSQGMFQWAALHIGELLQLERNADINKYLDGLPKGLEAAYDKIYEQITTQIGSKKDIAFAAFQVIMVSWRPLHPFELAIAVAQHPEHEFILDQNIDITYVLEACHNLLVITDGSQEGDVPVDSEEDSQRNRFCSYYYQDIEQNRTLITKSSWENSFGITRESICRFAHLSVQEYLETKHWSSMEAHGFMVGICLRTLLCLDVPGHVEAERKETDQSDGDNDFHDTVILRVSEFESKKIQRLIPLTNFDNETGLDSSADKTRSDNARSQETSYASSDDLEERLSNSTSIISSGELIILENTEDEGTSDNASTGPLTNSPRGHQTRAEKDTEDEPSIEPFTSEIPTFECYVELVNTHSHDDDQSCISHKFNPFLEGREGSPLEAWALYCAEGLLLHLKGKNTPDERRKNIKTSSLDLLEQFLGASNEPTVHYKAWVCLAQNLELLDEYARARVYSPESGLRDPSLSTYANLRAKARPSSKPALGCAILGLTEILERWLSNGELDPDECNAQGDSLLRLAAYTDNPELCKILLEHGANPNLPGSSPLTPLGLAVCHQKIGVVRVLAASGADLNATTVPIGQRREIREGSRAPVFDTPIEEAVQNSNADIVKTLLDAAKSTAYRGRPLQLKKALKLTAELARADLVDLILSHWGENRDIERQAVIYEALTKVPQTESGIDVMKVLVKHTKGREHPPLLHTAVTRENWAFAEALISVGLDVNSPNKDYYWETPLHSIFRWYCENTLGKAQKLIDWGANIDARDFNGNTPLALGMMTHLFNSETTDDKQNRDAGLKDPEKIDSQESRVGAIGELLRRGADTNKPNRDGLTPLGLACLYASVTPQVVQLLLDYGAVVNTMQGSSSITMSPLDILHLHDLPWSSEARPNDDKLETVKTMLQNHGGKPFLLVDYANWDSEKKARWIQDNRGGVFKGPNVMSCFSGHRQGISTATPSESDPAEGESNESGPPRIIDPEVN